MRILVTGATGFVGRHLLRELRQAYPGATLVGLARRRPVSPLPSEARFLAADLVDPEQARAAVREAAPDQVYHLAGEASGAGQDHEAIRRTNVGGTEALLDALEAGSGPVAVLLASTGYVYGPCREEAPATEDDPLDPRGAYAESKAAMEAMAVGRPEGRVRVVVARAFNHTGPGQTDRFAVPAFARQIAELAGSAREETDERALEVGNLDARRDFTDVRDVVRAYRLVLAAGGRGECFNVCSGRAVAMSEILDLLQRLAGTDFRARRDPSRERPLDVPVNVGSPRKLEERTGWRREFDLDATLSDVLAEWRMHRT
jgi:GDP-4-dehydro-6-deoxy-D-mannose reductase